MSGWTRIAFEAGGRPVEELEADLRSEVDDPETDEQYGHLVWKETRNFDPDRVVTLDVGAERVLVVRADDTSMRGSGHLFERIDGEFVLTDRFEGAEGFVGRDVIDYFDTEHGFRGVRE